jgi:hypothetical protein
MITVDDGPDDPGHVGQDRSRNFSKSHQKLMSTRSGKSIFRLKPYFFLDENDDATHRRTNSCASSVLGNALWSHEEGGGRGRAKCEHQPRRTCHELSGCRSHAPARHRQRRSDPDWQVCLHIKDRIWCAWCAWAFRLDVLPARRVWHANLRTCATRYGAHLHLSACEQSFSDLWCSFSRLSQLWRFVGRRQGAATGSCCNQGVCLAVHFSSALSERPVHCCPVQYVQDELNPNTKP